MPLRTLTAYRLRALREAKGLSQNDMANYLHITRTAYNKYEAGVIQPVRKLKELASLFHVTTDYILGYEPAPDSLLEPAHWALVTRFAKLAYRNLEKATKAVEQLEQAVNTENTTS